MKHLLILATMLLTFGFANAQSKIYQKNPGRIDYSEVGKSDTYQGGAAFLLLFY